MNDQEFFDAMRCQPVGMSVALGRYSAASKAPIAGPGQVIGVDGYISYNDDLPGSSIRNIVGKLREALLSDGDIILNINSPGGTVAGVQELSDMIFDMRSSRRIIAFANPLAASAAYWIGSAATEFYAAPMGEVGSIGVFRMHSEYSKMLENDGVTVTMIGTPEFKTEGNMYQPLSDEAKAYYQAQNDADYEKFAKSVARNRGITLAKVQSQYGKGRLLLADDAYAVGMIDGVRKAFTNTFKKTTNSRRAKVDTHGRV